MKYASKTIILRRKKINKCCRFNLSRSLRKLSRKTPAIFRHIANNLDCYGLYYNDM